MANKWIGVSATLNPGFLQDIKNIIDPVFAFVQTTLDLVNAVLQFVQAFLSAIGNPIKAILQQLINLLKGFLRDLRNTGLYVTYDTFAPNVPVISEENLKKLSGGYPVFQQRTIRKLTNPVDPTRPNFSKASSLLCVHAFGGGDLTSFFRIYNAIQELKRLFSNENTKASLPVPTNLSFEYVGYRGLAVIKKKDISENNLPTHLRVKWSLVPPSTGNGIFSGFVSPPPSFLIHVSTIPQGVIIGYDKIKTGSVVGSGLMTDPNTPNRVFNWYGFSSLINAPLDDISPEAFYFKLLPEDTKEHRLNSAELDKFQHTYYKSTNSFLSAVGGNDYYIDIPIEDLPKDLNVTSDGITPTVGVTENEVYVTIQSSTLVLENTPNETKINPDGFDSSNSIYDVNVFKPEVGYSKLTPLQFTAGVEATEAPQAIPIDVNFKPKALYLKALREALSWFLLARLDKLSFFETQDDDEAIQTIESTEVDDYYGIHFRPSIVTLVPGCRFLGVGLTDDEFKKALNILDIPLDLAGKKAFDDYFKKDKWAFASFIKDRVDRAVEKVTDYGFPPYDQLFAYKETFEKLYNASKDFFGSNSTLSLYEALSDNNFFTEEFELYGGPDSYGDDNFELRLGLSRLSNKILDGKTGVEASKATEFLDTNTFLQSSYPFVTQNGEYLDYPPWLWVTSPDIGQGIEAIIRMSATPLKYKQRDPDQGEWQFIKLFRDGFPAFEAFLQSLIAYAQAFADALNNIIQAIIDFIRILQQRILELKRFIAKIKALIDAILSFKLPTDLAFLYTVSAGTQGAVADLIQSEDKPTITGPYSFGMGATLVIGAPVPFITEIIDLMFGG